VRFPSKDLQTPASAESAGHDPGEIVGRDLPFYVRPFDVSAERMETIERVREPVLASVSAHNRFAAEAVAAARYSQSSWRRCLAGRAGQCTHLL
jgi:hypothetical protein